MSHIQWFPGHIAKAQKELKEKLNLIDVIVEVLDARLPLSSAYMNIEKLCPNKPRLILLNKIDLVEQDEIKAWQKYIKEKTKCRVLLISTGNQRNIKNIIENILELYKPMAEAYIKKQMLPRPARVMVLGLPNVGKSSIINRLIGKAKTKTGAKAGVTRMQQWVRVHPKVELLDTPGIIPMAQPNQEIALKLAYINCIGEKSYDSEFVAEKLLEFLQEKYEDKLRNYYGIKDEKITLQSVSLARNWIIKGGMPDILRTAEFVLLNFRECKIGKIILDEYPL